MAAGPDSRLPDVHVWTGRAAFGVAAFLLAEFIVRETEGSPIATPLDASRPMPISPSGNGNVVSFKGPDSTTSLGRNHLPRAFSYHTLPANSRIVLTFLPYPNG